MAKIAVAISTHNDEAQIADCIKSAKLLTDNIVVIDIQSTDQTVTIAKKAGATCHEFPFTPYVEPSRNFSLQKSPAEWVLILDADERVTQELAEEIKSIVSEDTRMDDRWSHASVRLVSSNKKKHTYYKIPRKNLFGGKKWLKHGGWWPDYQIRLIKKEAFIDWPLEIHSTPQIKGELGYLKNPLIHLAHGDFEEMVEKTLVFEDIESDLLYKAGRKASTLTFFRKFAGELGRRLLQKMGFLDGKIGILEGVYQAFSKTITYLLLYEKQLKSEGTHEKKNRTV